MPRIRIPSPLRPYADGQKEIETGGQTVDEVLTGLTERYPQLRQHLFTEGGELRSFVNVFLNDEDIRYLQSVETQVGAGDTLMIVPSVAGGKGGRFKLRANYVAQVAKLTFERAGGKFGNLPYNLISYSRGRTCLL
jgi:MoaD family protein